MLNPNSDLLAQNTDVMQPDADYKDDRNRRFDNHRDPKNRENFLEQVGRHEIRGERLTLQIENLEKELNNLPSDDEDMNKDQLHKKKELTQKLSHLRGMEHKNAHGEEKLEGRLANTNLKSDRNQIKQGKHKNTNEYGVKNEVPSD